MPILLIDTDLSTVSAARALPYAKIASGSIFLLFIWAIVHGSWFLDHDFVFAQSKLTISLQAVLSLIISFCAACLTLASVAWRVREFPHTGTASFVTGSVLLTILETTLRCSAADRDSGFAAMDSESHYPATFVLVSSAAMAWIGMRLHNVGALSPLPLLFSLCLGGCKTVLAMPYPRGLSVFLVPQSAALAAIVGYPHVLSRPLSSFTRFLMFCMVTAIALFVFEGPLFTLIARAGPWVSTAVKCIVASTQVLALSTRLLRTRRKKVKSGRGKIVTGVRGGTDSGNRSLPALRAVASFVLLAAVVMLLLDPGFGPLAPIMLGLTPRQQLLHAEGSTQSLLSSIRQDPSLLALFFAPALVVGASFIDTSKRVGRQTFLATVCLAGAVLGVYVSEMLLPDELATGDFAQYTSFCWLVHSLYGALFAVYSGMGATIVTVDLRGATTDKSEFCAVEAGGELAVFRPTPPNLTQTPSSRTQMQPFTLHFLPRSSCSRLQSSFSKKRSRRCFTPSMAPMPCTTSDGSSSKTCVL